MSSDQDPMLVVEKGIPSLRAISLEQQVCIIGASSATDVFIDNPFVSRMHAQIVVENDQYRVRDLDSRNGTFINGTRISGEGTRLRSGDRIELGEGQVVLKFQTRGTTLSLSTAPQKDAQALVVDEKSREVWVRGKELEAPLSRKEFDVLHFLYDRIGQACSKDEIAVAGWPERTNGDVGDHEIEQSIRRLRLRIEEDASQPQYIQTVRGYGYKLAVN